MPKRKYLEFKIYIFVKIIDVCNTCIGNGINRVAVERNFFKTAVIYKKISYVPYFKKIRFHGGADYIMQKRSSRPRF